MGKLIVQINQMFKMLGSNITWEDNHGVSVSECSVWSDECVESGAFVGVCYAPCSTPQSYYFCIFAMLSLNSPASLRYVVVDFCPWWDVNFENL